LKLSLTVVLSNEFRSRYSIRERIGHIPPDTTEPVGPASAVIFIILDALQSSRAHTISDRSDFIE
jgi:hypothetical protein